MSTAALAALEAAKVAATAATAAAAAAFSASAAAAAASLAAAETAAAAAMDADCLAPFSNTAARGSTAISRANHGSGFAQTAASGPTTAAPLVASTAYAAAQAATAAAAAASAAASMAREAAVAAKSLCSAASLAASAAAAGPGSASWSEIALALAMGTHSRLGAESALRRLDSDALRSLMAHVTLHVPRDAPTLSTALRRAGPWQRVLIARGEHALCDAAPSARPLLLLGEPGAVLRGTLVLGSAGGEVRGLRCDDAGDCCVRVLGGKWRFSNCRLRCSHASALHVSCDAQVELVECTLGGESAHEMGSHVVHLSAYGSVQVAGLAKRACFALVAKQKAVVAARRSDLSQCARALRSARRNRQNQRGRRAQSRICATRMSYARVTHWANGAAVWRRLRGGPAHRRARTRIARGLHHQRRGSRLHVWRRPRPSVGASHVLGARTPSVGRRRPAARRRSARHARRMR
uniref:Uncharacterized protein n=1 Tax=Chrysotila carterae TaxID=13221 RepID=A0A7S4BBI1_CHRCT